MVMMVEEWLTGVVGQVRFDVDTGCEGRAGEAGRGRGERDGEFE